MWSRSVVYIALAQRNLVTLGSCIAQKLSSAHIVIMRVSMVTFTVAKSVGAFLSERDFTVVSFWIISIAMVAAIVSSMLELGQSAHIGSYPSMLEDWCTHVAALYYMYMRGQWGLCSPQLNRVQVH